MNARITFAKLVVATLSSATLTFGLTAALLVTSSCKKDEQKVTEKKPPAKAPPQDAPLPAAPPAGSDADLKRAAALALAKEVDDLLGTLARVERELPAQDDGKARAAESWQAGKVPRKLVIKLKDATGVVSDTTDFYFDDKGKLGMVRAADGIFVFSQESLALWLDRDQRVKRGISPADARTRVDELRQTSAKALSTLGVR